MASSGRADGFAKLNESANANDDELPALLDDEMPIVADEKKVTPSSTKSQQPSSSSNGSSGTSVAIEVASPADDEFSQLPQAQRDAINAQLMAIPEAARIPVLLKHAYASLLPCWCLLTMSCHVVSSLLRVLIDESSFCATIQINAWSCHRIE
jgi:hypothetical protein